MSYKHVLSVLTLSALCSTLAQAEEDQPALKLRSLKYLGTGCTMDPTGPGVSISIENDSLKMTLPDMVAELGPAVPVVNNRKNCTVTMDLAVPAGWSYALESYRLGGYTSNSAGMKSELTLSNFFEGGATSPRVTTSWTGPIETDYVVADKIPFSNLLWSPCGVERRLVMNLQVRAAYTNKNQFPDAQGFVSLDSFQLKEFGVIWKKCQ